MINMRNILFVVCAVFLWQGVMLYTALSERTEEQISNNHRLTSLLSHYESLQETNNDWSERFASIKQFPDMLTLTEWLGLNKGGLKMDIDRLPQAISKFESVKHNGSEIGLVNLCLATRGSWIDFHGDSIDTMVRRLETIIESHNVRLSRLSVSLEDDKPVLSVENFCIWLGTQ